MQIKQNPILLVDDELTFLQGLRITLRSNNISDIVMCTDSRDVESLLSKQNFRLILLDLSMPYISGLDLLKQIENSYPGIPVIIVTAIDDLEKAVECIKAGAYNYLVKPLDEERLLTNVKRALEHYEFQNEIALLKHHILSDDLDYPGAFSEIITRDPKMHAIFKYAEAIGPTHLPVLITGDTGVGKELMAKAIHDISGLNGKHVHVNVAGLDDNMFSDTLFGHKKGAFTGAETERQGLISQAEGGTLFLDEIGDLKIESQVKILSLLQDGKYYQVGSDIQRVANIRIIAATNKNLMEKVQENVFRNDLYYRLAAHNIHIPMLRERKDDIPLLVDYYISEASNKLGKNKPTVPIELYKLLNTYHFPGNVRELKGMVYDAISRIKSRKLSMESFKSKIGYNSETSSQDDGSGEKEQCAELVTFSDKLPTLDQVEKSLIDEALKRAQGNQTIASKLLGISRPALYKRLKRL